MKLRIFENELLNCKTGIFINDSNEIFFRAKDVASYLSYGNTTQAINIHVDDDDKFKLEELWGLYYSSLTSNEKKKVFI
jgi:prophage antirepressor-like protein